MMETQQAVVREVTDQEVDFFFENGWVKLPGLVDPELTERLLEKAKELFGENGDTPLGDEAGPDLAWFRTYTELAEEDARYAALARSTELGRNASRLFGRTSPIRLMQNSLMVKLPSGRGAQDSATAFHQDTGAHLFHDANSVNVWLALDEVTSDMGGLRFYSGSHKFGQLGNLGDPGIWEGWQARLERECTLTDPVELQPGDATIHTHFMVHGTTENSGGRPRWAWGAMLLPGDARYTGARSYYTDGLGLTPFGSLDHPKFPVIYAPEQ